MLTRPKLLHRERPEHIALAVFGHSATLNISARLRAASACDIPLRYAARLIGSPPLASLRAKSAQRPVFRLTEKEPGRRSTRLGFLAIHSLPRRKPSGSHRVRSAGRQARAAALTASKSILRRVSVRSTVPASSRWVRDETLRPPRVAARSGLLFFQTIALLDRRRCDLGLGTRRR